MNWQILEAISAAIAAIFTGWILFVAWSQLKASNAIATADFALRFKSDFFKKETREIMMLLTENLLQFETEGDFAYFKITPFDFETKAMYSVYEVDDFLLAHLEDLGMFEEKGILDIDYIYEGFSWFIVAAFENEQIKKYIEWSRSDGEDIYEKLECIYHKVKAEEHKRSIRRKCHKA